MIVDTSVWIEFFRKNTENEKVQILTDALNTNKPIYMTDIILTEILQGIKDDNKYAFVKNALLALNFIHAQKYKTYIKAADIYRACRKNGITIRKSNDCIIAAIVLENDVKLLTLDRDFENISKEFPLQLI